MLRTTHAVSGDRRETRNRTLLCAIVALFITARDRPPSVHVPGLFGSGQILAIGAPALFAGNVPDALVIALQERVRMLAVFMRAARRLVAFCVFLRLVSRD